MKKLAPLFKRAAVLSKPTKKQFPDEWAAENRFYASKHDRPGPRNPNVTPYMTPFARSFHDPKYDNVVLCCSAQMGKTETMLDIIGSGFDQRPRPTMLIGPDEKFVLKEHEPRVAELIESSPSLKLKTSTGKKSTKYQKIISGVPMRLAWAGSESQLSGMAAQLVLFDEIDRVKAIKGKGDPFGIVKARGDSYRDSKRGVMSTPTEANVEVEVCPDTGLVFWKKMSVEEVASAIWRLWQAGTMHHWCWRCVHCGEWFVPRMSCLKGHEGKQPARAKADAFIECPHNGCVLTDADKIIMNASGRYVAPGQSIDAEGNVTGDPPETVTLSYWVSGLASPFKTFGERAARLVEAQESGTIDELQSAINTAFGECYTPGIGQVPEWQKVMQHAAEYDRGEVPPGVRFLTLAADVQGYGIYYAIRGWGAFGTSWLVDWGLLHGSTIEDDVWDRLEDVITGTYGGKDDVDGMHISRALIDAGCACRSNIGPVKRRRGAVVPE